MGGGWQSEDEAAHLYAESEAAAAEAEMQAAIERVTMQFVKIEVGMRELVRHYGFKGLSDYYKAREKFVEDLPEDFTHDTGDYVITKGVKTSISRSLDEKKQGPTIDKPTLIVTRKKEEK